MTSYDIPALSGDHVAMFALEPIRYGTPINHDYDWIRGCGRNLFTDKEFTEAMDNYCSELPAFYLGRVEKYRRVIMKEGTYTD
jgi:hypothetical protein